MNALIEVKGHCCPTCGAKLDGRSVEMNILKEIRLSKNKRRIVDYLMDKHPFFVKRPAIFNAVYFDDPNGGPLEEANSLRVAMSQLKKNLAPYGWTIESGAGGGRGREGSYRLARFESVE